MQKNKPPELQYWHIKGKKYDSALAAAQDNSVSRYTILRWCGRIKKADGTGYYPAKKDCVARPRTYEEGLFDLKMKCSHCGTAFNLKTNNKDANTGERKYYCAKCKVAQKGYRGKTSEELNELHYKALGLYDEVRVLTKKEIEEVEQLYTPPVQRKRGSNFTFPI